jgi:hypothetical protein
VSGDGVGGEKWACKLFRERKRNLNRKRMRIASGKPDRRNDVYHITIGARSGDAECANLRARSSSSPVWGCGRPSRGLRPSTSLAEARETRQAMFPIA